MRTRVCTCGGASTGVSTACAESAERSSIELDAEMDALSTERSSIEPDADLDAIDDAGARRTSDTGTRHGRRRGTGRTVEAVPRDSH